MQITTMNKLICKLEHDAAWRLITLFKKKKLGSYFSHKTLNRVKTRTIIIKIRIKTFLITQILAVV